MHPVSAFPRFPSSSLLQCQTLRPAETAVQQRRAQLESRLAKVVETNVNGKHDEWIESLKAKLARIDATASQQAGFGEALRSAKSAANDLNHDLRLLPGAIGQTDRTVKPTLTPGEPLRSELPRAYLKPVDTASYVPDDSTAPTAAPNDSLANNVSNGHSPPLDDPFIELSGTLKALGDQTDRLSGQTFTWQDRLDLLADLSEQYESLIAGVLRTPGHELPGAKGRSGFATAGQLDVGLDILTFARRAFKVWQATGTTGDAAPLERIADSFRTVSSELRGICGKGQTAYAWTTRGAESPSLPNGDHVSFLA